MIKKLTTAGFVFGRSSTHLARTIMLADLKSLFSYVPSFDASKDDYRRAIIENNCLGKQTMISRLLSFRHLAALYSLEPNFLLFRGLRYFWAHDEAGKPLLAFLCAYARDPLLRLSARLILPVKEGYPMSSTQLEAFLEQNEPDRFSKNTLTSAAQNINSSWTQSGHLTGNFNKIRSRVVPTPGTAAYALFLSYISGHRGLLILESEYVKLLDCSAGQVIELAREESLNGGMVLKLVADVMEISFPKITGPQQMELLHD